MKKIFTFIVALCMGMAFANAQIDSVIVNGNGTYEQYVDTVVTPVDSTMYFDTIDIVYDTTVVIDTTGDVVDTLVTVDTVYVVDTNYTAYDTAVYNMIIAIPDSGWVFVNWVVTLYDSAEYVDTVFVNPMYVDWTDSLVSVVLNFDTADAVGITNVVNNYDIKLYPNPTTNYVNVDVENYKNCTVYNMNGSVMAFTTSNRVDMTNMPCGMYIMQIRLVDNTVLTHKIMKK